MYSDYELAELLKNFHIETARWFKEVFKQDFLKQARTNITQTQYRILRRIKNNQPCKMGELSSCSSVSFGSMTIMVNKLVEEGLVKRMTSHEDRRVILVSLTEEGEKILKEFQDQFIEVLKKRVSRLDKPKKDRLYTVLKQFMEIIREL
ncbi:MAG: hypothetical protein PWQ82_1224 [Thermosediminibacterales bacterium]|nr:hypothetical protein [Thermosediminibacterales bacterium]